MRVKYHVSEAKIVHNEEHGDIRVILLGSYADEAEIRFEVAVKWPDDTAPDESAALRFLMGHMDDMIDVLMDSNAMSNRVKDFE